MIFFNCRFLTDLYSNNELYTNVNSIWGSMSLCRWLSSVSKNWKNSLSPLPSHYPLKIRKVSCGHAEYTNRSRLLDSRLVHPCKEDYSYSWLSISHLTIFRDSLSFQQTTDRVIEKTRLRLSSQLVPEIFINSRLKPIMFTNPFVANKKGVLTLIFVVMTITGGEE